MKVIVSFAARKWAWAKDNPLFWCHLFLAFSAVLVTMRFPGPVLETGLSDFRIKTLGMVLQLIGVYTVWHDLTNTGRTFGKTGFLKRTAIWLKEGIFGRNQVIAATGIASSAAVGNARGNVRRAINPAASVEQRLIDLEYNLQRIDDDISSVYREIDQNHSDIRQQLEQEAQRRQSSHRELEERLKDSVAGNYAVLAFGVFWLVIGMLISTWAPELARILGGQWVAVIRSI